MKKHFRAPHPGRILLYALLILAAGLVLLPIVLTFLYSFFPPTEIAAYLKTRNNYSADQFMDLLLSLNLSGAGFAASPSCFAV